MQAEALHTADLTTGAKRDGVQVSAGYAFGNGVRVEAGVRRSHEEAGDSNTVLSQPDLTSVRGKIAAQVPGLPQAGVYAEAEQDVRDSGRRMVALGGDYRLAGGSRLYGRHELISSLGSNYALNDSQQRNATVFGIDADYMKDGRVFSEYRARGSDLGAIGSRQAEAALGLRNLWQIADGVRGSTSFERVRVLSGSTGNEAVALAGAIEYSRTPILRVNARLELRHADDSDNVLNTVGLAYRLSDTLAFLGWGLVVGWGAARRRHRVRTQRHALAGRAGVAGAGLVADLGAGEGRQQCQQAGEDEVDDGIFHGGGRKKGRKPPRRRPSGRRSGHYWGAAGGAYGLMRTPNSMVPDWFGTSTGTDAVIVDTWPVSTVRIEPSVAVTGLLPA